MIAWAFDVDSLTHGDNNFQQWFLNWATDKSIYLLTDKDRSEVARFLPLEFYSQAKICFYCMGNTIITYDEITNLNHFKLTEEEYNWLSNLGPVTVKGGCVSVKCNDLTLNTINEFNNKFNRLEAFIQQGIMIVVRRGAGTGISFNLIQQLPNIHSINFVGSGVDNGGIFKAFSDKVKEFHGTVIQSGNFLETKIKLEKL